jgi:hypothetical protein
MEASKIESAEMGRYFSFHKQKLQKVIQAYCQTVHGKQRSIYGFPRCYEDFLEFPFMEDGELSSLPLDFYIPSGDDIEFVTSGTSGRKKRIFRPSRDSAIPLPPDLDQIIRQNDTVFVHSKRYQLESFYWLLDKTYSENYSASPCEYDSLESVIEILKEGTVLCIYDYPTAFYRFLFLVQKGLQEGRISFQAIRKNNVLIELTGEPMSMPDLQHALDFAQNAFQCPVNIWATYGSAEIGGIAYYDFNGDDQEIDYTVASKRVFVEVIDPTTGNPRIGTPGEIVVTALRGQGTIILRYRTGDKGVLSFKDGIPHLSHLQRPSVVFVAGSQFNIQDILRSLREELGVIAQLSVSRERDDERGFEKLFLRIFILESFGIEENFVKEFLKNRIIEEAKLDSEISLGLVEFLIEVFNISLEQITFQKAWAISQ